MPAYEPKNGEERAAIDAYAAATEAYFDRWKAALRKAAGPVRIVDVSNGDHSLFLSHEADVLREVRAFLRQL